MEAIAEFGDVGRRLGGEQSPRAEVPEVRRNGPLPLRAGQGAGDGAISGIECRNCQVPVVEFGIVVGELAQGPVRTLHEVTAFVHPVVYADVVACDRIAHELPQAGRSAFGHGFRRVFRFDDGKKSEFLGKAVVAKPFGYVGEVGAGAFHDGGEPFLAVRTQVRGAKGFEAPLVPRHFYAVVRLFGESLERRPGGQPGRGARRLHESTGRNIGFRGLRRRSRRGRNRGRGF